MSKISKFLRIRSIGNFEDCQPHGDVTLKKFNFIYAENGAGKTTLASIFHSLSSNDGSIIDHHKRLGSTKEQLVEIKLDDNSTCRFDKGKWNRRLSDIEVFDANFVSNNVFTGMTINLENRRSLYNFVLGDEGVKISKKIAKAKRLMDDTLNVRNQVETSIKNKANIEDIHAIVNISQDPDIDQKIIEKEREKKIAAGTELIRTHEGLPKIGIFHFPVDLTQGKELLLRSMETISEQYIVYVTKHVKELMSNGMKNPESWLQQGAKSIISNNRCPFCDQSLDKAKMTIESYRQYFNKEYNDLVDQIKALKSNIDNLTPDTIISKLRELDEKFLNQYNFWKNYIPDLMQVPTYPTEIDKYKSEVDFLKSKTQEKVNSPLTPISYDDAELIKIIQAINGYYLSLTNYSTELNAKIKDLKTNIKSVDTIEKELAQLQLIKRRFESPLKELCDKYALLSNRHRLLSNINRKLQQKQKQDSANFLATYGTKINYYLNNIFHTDFQLKNIKEGGYKGKSKDNAIEYELTFKGQLLVLDADEPLSVKNSLSEGDKNAIAFCLFLAKLENYSQDNLANKIIVFDDPLTSFDQNRRNSTIAQLVDLYGKCAQMLVLSHNLSFLIELHGHKGIKKSDKKVLRIQHSIYPTDHSSIEEYEFKDEKSSNFASYIDSMETYLDAPTDRNKESALRSIRLALEAYLKFKYGRYLTSLDSEFGKVIHDLETNTDCSFNEGTDKQDVINDLNKLNSISWRAHHATVDEIEVGQYQEVHITGDELQRIYIPMTLKLLFSKL